MKFMIEFSIVQGVYNFAKTVKSDIIIFKYTKGQSKVVFVIIEPETSSLVCIIEVPIEACNVSNVDLSDLVTMMPPEMSFSKNNNNLIELTFSETKIKSITRYIKHEKTKMVQEFPKSISSYSEFLTRDDLNNVICSSRLMLTEFKDMIDFFDATVMVLHDAGSNEIRFQLVGKDKYILKTCKSHQAIDVSQTINSNSFTKLKGLGTFSLNKKKLFSELEMKVCLFRDRFFITLHSLIFEDILVVISPAGVSQSI